MSPRQRYLAWRAARDPSRLFASGYYHYATRSLREYVEACPELKQVPRDRSIIYKLDEPWKSPLRAFKVPENYSEILDIPLVTNIHYPFQGELNG